MLNKNLFKFIGCILLCFCFVVSISAIGWQKVKNDKEENLNVPVSATAASETEARTEPKTEPPTSAASKPEKRNLDDISGEDKLIALTFDDGPYGPVTEKILDVLEQNGAVATFFVVGNRTGSYKSSLKRASDMGCEIGSHTHSHANLTKLTPEKMADEISRSNEAIKNITGKDIRIVRPPEGAVNDDVLTAVDYPLILWNVDSKDWKYRNPDKNYHEVVDFVSDGCIVLMHDLYGETADAISKIIPALANEGYKFVTVSELMELRDVDFTGGRTYSSAKPAPPEEEAEEY